MIYELVCNFKAVNKKLKENDFILYKFGKGKCIYLCIEKEKKTKITELPPTKITELPPTLLTQYFLEFF